MPRWRRRRLARQRRKWGNPSAVKVHVTRSVTAVSGRGFGRAFTSRDGGLARRLQDSLNEDPQIVTGSAKVRMPPARATRDGT